MKIFQQTFDYLPTADELASLQKESPHLLLVFGPPVFFENGRLHSRLRAALPDTLPIGASSGGNISPAGLCDGTLQLTGIRFDDPALVWTSVDPRDFEDSFAAGIQLGEQLAQASARHVLLFSQRRHTSSHRLLQGLKSKLPGISITGGVACNPYLSPSSYTLGPDGVSDSRAVALGFCSQQLHVSSGISSGWRPFGPARCVTHSSSNILHALDGESALTIYRRYLGHHIEDWHNARLLFSFEMLDGNRQETGLIRAVQSYDENDGSLILTDDIQQGSYLRLMHGSTNALVCGAESAVDQAFKTDCGDGEKLALIISCVGRRIIMGQQADEEIEAIQPHLNPPFRMAGFYAHGEYGTPDKRDKTPHILNETLSVTLLGETAC